MMLHRLFKKRSVFNPQNVRPLREYRTFDEVFPFSWGWWWWFGLYPEIKLRHRLKRLGPIWHGEFRFISIHSLFCAWESARAFPRVGRARCPCFSVTRRRWTVKWAELPLWLCTHKPSSLWWRGLGIIWWIDSLKWITSRDHLSHYSIALNAGVTFCFCCKQLNRLYVYNY